MRSWRWSLPTALLLFVAVGCGKKTEQQTNTASGITEVTSTISISISSAWQDDEGEYEVHQTCSESGSKTSPGSSNCNVSIGEEKLNLSSLKFSMSSSGSCAVINFRPYRYRLSNSATYTPPDLTDPIDCSLAGTDEDPIACWGGAAKEIVPTFPLFGSIFTTKDTLEAIVSSSNEKREYDNRYTSNDMPLVERATTIPSDTSFEGYVGNSMLDYRFTCQDEWSNTLASITIFILDYDGADPLTDHIPSWDN